MPVVAPMPAIERTAANEMAPPSRFGDKAFEWLTLAMAMAVVALVFLVGWQLARGSSLAIQKFGFHFFATSTWDPVAEQFGALPFIYGTVVSSLIGLIIAVPLSIATAVYLTELAPLWIRQPLVSLIEMLAAIPSVILGLWGIFVMIPWLRDYPFPLLKKMFGWTPLFRGPIYGVSMLAGGIIIAIMILPIITSVSREILRSVPNLQREAAYALGATRWEVTRIAVLSYARKGLFGAVIHLRGRRYRATRSRLLSSAQEWREFGELGFLHPTAQTSRRDRRRHGERDRRLVRIARAGGHHRRADWCAGRSLPRGIWVRPRQRHAALRRGCAERRSLHHLGNCCLWACRLAFQRLFRLCGWTRARLDDGAIDHAHDRGSAPPRAER